MPRHITKTSYKKGHVPYMKGKHHTEGTKEKICQKRIEWYKNHPCALKGKNNPMYGKGYLLRGEKHGMYGKHHKKETIEKIKKWRKTFVLPIKDTSIEVKIQNFLKKLGIEFFTHQHLNIKHSYQCDILIPAMNLVIECDGDYWHKYPVGNDLDHIRTKELISKGFKVLRLWEFEINEMSIKEFENKLNI